MFVTLFLPIDPEITSNWAFILFHSLETPLCTPFLLAVPILILCNVLLMVFPSDRVKKVYRIFLLVLFPLVWFGTLITTPPFRGAGFWAKPAVVSAAALLEIVFVLWERREKSGGTGLETS
jgi:hypothetical protein